MTYLSKTISGMALFGFCTTGVPALAGPQDAHEIDLNDEKVIMCRGPLKLHHESVKGYNAIVIESTLPFANAGNNGQLLKRGQCGNPTKSSANTKFIRWSPKTFENIMYGAEQSFQFALICLMSEKYVYAFKDKYLTGRSHCIPLSTPNGEPKRARQNN